jgi:hypothetical protein
VITNAWKVTVTKADGTSANALPVWYDSDADVAELQVDGPSTGLTFSTSAPSVGQHVFLIGNPLGTNPNTVTEGRVAQVNASVQVEGQPRRGVVVTDADAEHGNSGGPAVDERGHVLGIVTGGTLDRHGSFFQPYAAFRSDILRQNGNAGQFIVPLPLIRATAELPSQCPVAAGCSLGATFTNFGGPGHAEANLCTYFDDSGSALPFGGPAAIVGFDRSNWGSCDESPPFSVPPTNRCRVQVTLGGGETQQARCNTNPGRSYGGTVSVLVSVKVLAQQPIPS